MLRFSSLGSGSRGNATLVETDQTCIMVDCGFSVIETRRRLARLGKTPADIHGILVTHEHSDHISGVAGLARRFAIPVWMTAGTSVMHADTDIPSLDWFHGHAAFAIGDLHITPFPVPHDAREPCQFVFSDGVVRLGVLTDTGSITGHIRQVLDGCEALLLECNHDTAMLANGPYPTRLKRRVGGHLGHLSNAQAADLLSSIDVSALKQLAIAHLSDKNNRPELARSVLAQILKCAPEWIAVADQATGLEWRHVG